MCAALEQIQLNFKAEIAEIKKLLNVGTDTDSSLAAADEDNDNKEIFWNLGQSFP
jgi:hypothetical protein